MSYDLMNCRDTVTKHHSSVADAESTIKGYLAIGAPPSKLNLDFAYYAKYFTTQGDCSLSPLNCPIALAEDAWGQDTFKSGAWTFEKSHMHPVDTSALTVVWDGTCGPEKGTKCGIGCCSQFGHCGTSHEHCNSACQHAFGTGCTDADVAGSWQLAAKYGVTDEAAGGQYYFDALNRLFWTWDTPTLITRKFDNIVRRYKLGGVMAWSLGEDSLDWSHIRQMANEVAKGGLGLVTASDSVLPIDGYVHAQEILPGPCCSTTKEHQSMQNSLDPAASATPLLSYDTYLVDCGDGNGLTQCGPGYISLPHHHLKNYDGNDSVQQALNDQVDLEIGTMRQDFSTVMTVAEIVVSTAVHLQPAATIDPGFTTHIGIPQAQESEFPSGSYRMRRRERAHKV
jgi:hypothetical protein